MEKISIQKIKWLRSLRLKKNRDELELFLCEGEKMFTEILKNHKEKIVFALSSIDLYEKFNLEKITNTFIGSDSEIKSVSNLSSPQKIITVVSKLKQQPIDLKKKIIVLDGIQDPGNLGTIIRTADWFGINQLVCSPDTVDCYNQKVIQATMGSIFNINICYTFLPDFLASLPFEIHGAMLKGKSLTTELPENLKVVVLGNEGKGISEHVLPFISKPISIQGSGQAESLNVAIAAGIIFNHWSN